jgi:hypothetical protein
VKLLIALVLLGISGLGVMGSVAGSATTTAPGSYTLRVAPLFPWVPAGGYADHFPYGECTWWAAYNHRVAWSGNATDWLINARAKGIATSAAPTVGAVAVYRAGRAYSVFGHVAVVIKVDADTYRVSEMNYRGWGVIDERELRLPDRELQGFIP